MKHKQTKTDTARRWARLMKSKGGGMTGAAYHWTKMLFFAAAFLFFGAVQDAQAAFDNINNTNIIAAGSEGYDTNRGFWKDYTIYFYDEEDKDEWIEWGYFKVKNASGTFVSAFEIDSKEKGNNGEPSNRAPVDFIAKNGFYLTLSGYTKSGSWTSYTSNGSWTGFNFQPKTSGNMFKVTVRLFFPNEYMNKNVEVIFDGTIGGNNSNTNGTPFSANPGSINNTNKLPTISEPKVSIDPKAWTYTLDYSLNKYIAKAGTLTLSDPSWSSTTIHTGSIASDATSGTITGNSSSAAYTLLDHGTGIPRNNAKLEIKWTHSNTGIVYSTVKEGIKIDHIKFPKFTSLTNNNDGTLSLAWSLTDIKSDNTSNYRLQYKAGSADWKNVPSPAPSYSNGDLQYTFTIPSAEVGKGKVSYQFRINRSCFDEGYCQSSKSITVNTNYEKAETATGENIVLADDGKVYFKVIEGIRPSNFGYGITGKVVETSANVSGISTPVVLAAADPMYKKGYRWSFEPNIAACTPTIYSIQAKTASTNQGDPVNVTLTWSPTKNSEIVDNSFRASKGFFNDHVELNWEVKSNASDFTNFIINRYLANDESGDSKSELLNTPYNKGTDGYVRSFTDNSASAGSFYRYELIGKTTCASVTTTKTLASEIGFAQAFGSISGHVTFSTTDGTTGSGVPNVDIIFENNDDKDDLGRNKAIDFNTQTTEGYLTFPTPYVAQSPALTIQMWLKLRNEKPAGQGHQIFYGCVPGTGEELIPQLDIWLDEDRQLGFELFGDEANSKTLTDTVFPINEYFHYTGVITRVNTTYTLTNYLNGKPIGNLTVNNAKNLNFTTGRVGDDETEWKIDGCVDELRLWNRALTAAEIAENYDRYILPNSTGLKGYYRFDEPDGAKEQIFDISLDAATEKYNENHGMLVGDATRTATDAPSPELLSLKAKTNPDGTYYSGQILPYGDNTQ